MIDQITLYIALGSYCIGICTNILHHFLAFVVFVLGDHEKSSNNAAPFGVHHDAQIIAGLIKPFTQAS